MPLLAKAFIPLLLLTATCLGCESAPSAGQTFRINVHTEVPCTFAYCVGTVERSGNVDSAAPETQSLRDASLHVAETGTFSVSAGKSSTFSVPIFWYNRFEDFQVTIFAPGYVVTTLYPRGFGGNSSMTCRTVYQPVIGWRRNKYRVMSAENGMSAGERFHEDQKDVSIDVTLRPLRIDGRRVRPSPDLNGLPAESLCDVDALNFVDQLELLNEAQKRSRVKFEDTRARQCVGDAMDAEHAALVKAGFGDLISR